MKPIQTLFAALVIASTMIACNQLPAAPAKTQLLPVPCDLTLQSNTVNTANCGGGGGGGGGGGTPPAPTVDISQSYLTTAARDILALTGVPQPWEIGGTQWVAACTARAEQGAVTFNSGVTRICTYAAPTGWVVLETSYTVDENKHDRGSFSVSTVDGPTSVSTLEFGSKFNAAIDLAVTMGDNAASQKIQLEYQRLNGFNWAFDGHGSSVLVSVTANGGLLRKSIIQVSARAKLLRIY